MNDRSFNAVSRRASLLAFGAVGLSGVTTLSDSGTTVAKKKKKCNPTKKCKQQVGQCTSLLTAICGDQPACQDSIDCCPILGTCDADAFISCLIASFSAP